jgi:hypothetical protein
VAHQPEKKGPSVRRIAVFTCVTAIALLAAGTHTTNGLAHGAGIPYHQQGSVTCGQGFVNARTPGRFLSWYQRTYANTELVHWSPELYRWNGERWQFVAQGHWFRAHASSYGLWSPNGGYGGAWTDTATLANAFGAPFRNLRPGYYRTRQLFHWNAVRHTHAEWSGYCLVS